MWRPKERIKHALPAPAWPTAEEARQGRWFLPIRLGPVALETRTWVPAMVPWRATADGNVTDRVLAWYERFAEGRPGAIVVEATGVRDVPSGPLLRIGHDRFLPGLTELAATIHRASAGHTRAFIQIIDFLTIRRRPRPEDYFRRFLTITDTHRQAIPGDDPAIRERLLTMTTAELQGLLTPGEYEALTMGYRERVTDTHLDHIRELPQVLPGLFAGAARRAAQAGFDGVELHFAHAYTMASFLSALNTRDDGYGGDPPSRVRLPLEVYQAVRAATGDRFAVGCRFLAEECIPGGSTVDDAAYFAVAFAAAGIDFLSLSRGGKFEDAAVPRVGSAAYPYTGPSGYECMPTIHSDQRGPFGRNIAATSAIRAAVRAAGHPTPVVVAGGIASFAQAEAILANGQADIVAAARQCLADPDWFRKVRQGRGAAVRRCEFTNYCEALDQRHSQVTCKLWDRLELDEPGVQLSDDGRRRLIAPRPARPTD